MFGDQLKKICLCDVYTSCHRNKWRVTTDLMFPTVSEVAYISHKVELLKKLSEEATNCVDLLIPKRLLWDNVASGS